MTIDIRKAHPEDISVLVEFQKLLAQETENMILHEPTLKNGIVALINDASKGSYYIAEIEGHIVGCFMITYEWSEWRNGSVYWLQSVYVRSSYRGRGVFKKIFAYLQVIVNSNTDVIGLRLYTNKSNTKAQAVYRALGMEGEHNMMFEIMKS